LRALGKVLGQGVQKAWLNRQLETHARYIESYLAKTAGLPVSTSAWPIFR
jgi:glutathione S-transferase